MRFSTFTLVLFLFGLILQTDGWLFRSSSSRGSSRSSSSRSWRRPSLSRGSSGRWWASSGSSGSSSSRGGSSRQYSYDLDRKGLTNLYNSRVTRVESVERPLNGPLGKLGIKHTGVVATTADGGRWLIHKGDNYGKASSTVVTNARHMSDRWSTTGSRATSGQTLSDLMKAGYVDKPYGFTGDGRICWDASKNIMKSAGKRRQRRRSC